jgi:hypothetical protein
MNTLFWLVSVGIAAPFVYDDGDVRCVMLEDEPVGVHEQALADWAPRGTLASDEVLEPCAPVRPRRVDCPAGLGSALPFASAVEAVMPGEGVKVSEMSSDWLHVRGQGDLAVRLSEGPPVLLRVEAAAPESPQVRPGTVVELGFDPEYIGGSGEVVRVGTAVLVLKAGDLYIKEDGEAPRALSLAPASQDAQLVIRPGQTRTVAVEQHVMEVVVGDPLVAGVVVRGRRVRVMASSAGETRMAVVLEGGQILPVRVIVR